MVDPARLESVPALAALPAELRAELAEAFDELDIPAGEQIASQGDFAYHLYAIVEGTARVEQDGETIAALGPGELFGELGVLLTGRRTAGVVAETPMVLLALFEQTYRRLCKEYPALSEAVHGESRGRFTRSVAG